MKKELFDELVESVREGMAIRRGHTEPSRVFVVEKKTDVKAVRSKLGVSQNEFAELLGISRRTLENWEQGRRTPKGPAKVLLKVAEAHPEAVWEVVKKQRHEGQAPQQ
ncbi:MAG: helix-turn-helix domain-containing protein [Desulfomonile tiedjei]|nr:helix-turn-helix domain-containing protein [Desulfomonile tiedjei]